MTLPLILKSATLSAATINPPLQTLASQIDRLSDIVEASSIAQSWYARDVPLAPGVVVGMAVYWNTDNARYEAGLAAATTDPVSGEFKLTDSSDAVGLVTAVNAGNIGDVLLDGIADVDLSSVISGAVAPGRYYLSNNTSGHLVPGLPPVSVFICRVLGKLNACHTVSQVLVRPQLRDALLDHLHYRFALACFPAGATTPPVYGHKHVITSPDPAKKGWLPANHAIFAGNAPLHAVFGYNLVADPALATVWPPVPVFSVAVILDRGIGQGAAELPQGSNGLVICDAHGIWWMSDCYSDAPWPMHLDTTIPYASSYPHATSNDECPRIDHMRIEVVYLRMLYANDRFVVTSLSTGVNSPLVLTGNDSIKGKTGDVSIAFEPGNAIIDTNAIGGTAIKSIGSDFKQSTGWLVEGLTTASSAVTLTATHTRRLNPADGSSPIVSQGIVQIDVASDPANRDLSPTLIRLAGAVERFYQNVPYIGFPANKETSIRMSFNVPLGGVPVSAKFRLRLMLLGRAAGTMTAMTASYRRAAILDQDATTNLPTSDTALTIDTTVTVTTDQLAGSISSPITVQPGDTVFITLTRPVDVSFNGEMGLVRISGIISVS